MSVCYTGNVLLYNGQFGTWTLTNDSHSCNENEDYRNTPYAIGNYIETRFDIEMTWDNNYNGASLQEPGGRSACYIVTDEDNTNILTGSNGINGAVFTVDQYPGQWSEFPYLHLVTSVRMTAQGNFETNIPVFLTMQEATEYINAASDEIAKELIKGALNYKKDQYVPDETEKYFLYNAAYRCKVERGEYERLSNEPTSLNTIFRANKRPALYFTGNGFELTLLCPECLDYVQSQTPAHVLEDIDPINYTVGTPPHTTPFYGNIPSAVNCNYPLPEDGTYLYALGLNTNIPIFKSREDAQNAINTGDYSAAGNYYQIQDGDTVIKPSLGNEELETIFGEGMPTSPFAAAYVMSKTEALNIAGIFYTDNTTLIDNIKKGLELFGSKPIDAIISLTWYPFPVTDMVTTQSQSHVYFGSYQHTGVNVNKIIAMTSNYINAGSVLISPLFNSYRDFSPYTTLSVYLPYHGWENLEIEKYIGKNVNIRYYVDIYTNSGVIALVGDGLLIDAFPIANMGITMPIAGTNLSEYANSMLNGLLGAGGGAIGGALSGAMAGSVIPGVGTLAGAGVGAGLGLAGGLARGVFEMSQKGTPKDHMMMKGSFSAGSGSYMPQYVIFRYDVNDIIVPDNLTQMYGRPSSYGGTVGSFSGFLSCDTFKLNTGNMTDTEITEASNLLASGVYV